MRAVWTKIKADLTHRPMVSLLILLTIAASATLLTLATATLTNMSAPYDTSFHELNAAHVWLFFDRQVASRGDISRIEALPGITASTGLRPYVLSRVRLGDNAVWVSLRAEPADRPTVNRLLITAGEGLPAGPAAGQHVCVLGKELDDLYAIEIGQAARVTRADGREVALPIVGLAYNPMWDTYRTSQPPYVYVSEATLRELFPDEESWGWSLGLRLADPNAVTSLVAQVEELLGAGAVTGYTDWRDVKRAAAFGAQINFIFLGAFSGFAILATVLVIASSIGSIVLSQFRQIGILKTLGFTRDQILWLYLGQYLLLTAIGVALGLIAGSALAPLPLKSVAASLSTAYRPPLSPLLIATVLGITTGVVAVAVLGAAKRGAETPIVLAITGGAEPVHPRRPARWGTPGGLAMPIVVSLGVQEIFSRPLRSLLTGVNLTLGVMGIAFGLTLANTLDGYRANPALLGIVYDAAATRYRMSDRQAQQLLSRSPGVEAVYSEYQVEAEAMAPPSPGRTFSVRAVEGELDAFPFPITEGRCFDPDRYEAIAGRGLLDWLGLEVGDTLTVTFREGAGPAVGPAVGREVGREAGRPVSWQIVGQYTEPADMGQVMMVSGSLVSRWVKGVEPASYFLKLAPDHDPGALRAHLADRSREDLNVVFVDQTLPDAVRTLQLAIYGLATILIGIALINVFNTSLLSTREKVRVIGILKTVGMTPLQVVAMVNVNAACLGLMAAAIGAPLGFVFTRAVLRWLAHAYGFGPIHVLLDARAALLLVPLMLLVSLAGSALPSLQAARASIVEVIAHE